MTKLGLTILTVGGLTMATAILPGCATSAPPATSHESAGEYIDDSVITTRVKSAFLGEESLKSMQIGVETYKGVVQLSGFVDSRQAVHRAGEVASHVKGVRSVKNDLAVK
jgi:osmotically-inducible protein OsmY